MICKPQRLFYLDFIRAIAVFTIILTHYNALYIYMEPQHLEKTILTVYPFGIYIGNLGVAWLSATGLRVLMRFQSEIH